MDDRQKDPEGLRKTEKLSFDGTAMYRALFDSSRDAVGVSKAGIHLLVNNAYLDLFGFPRDYDITGRPVLDLIAPASRAQISDYIRRRSHGETVTSLYETRGLRADGTEFDMEVSVSLYPEHGENHTLVILRDISERTKAAEEIAEREAMLRQIMDTASVAIFLIDKTGHITTANNRMADMFGCPMEELIGSEYVDHVHPLEREIGRQKMLALLASKIPSVDLERLYLKKDGAEFWGHLAGRRFHDVRGNELGLIGVITDITMRKMTETALRESEATARTLLDIPVAAAFLLDRDGKCLDANETFAQRFGKTRTDVIGLVVWDLFPPEVAERRRAHFEQVLKDKKMVRYEDERGGRWNDSLIAPILDSSGEVSRIAVVGFDITERKQSELALQKSEAKYRRLYNETPILLHSIDRNGVVVEANDYWFKIMGYERNEVIGKKVTDFYTDASKKYALEIVQPAFFRDGVVKDVSYQFVKKNGDVVDVLLSATGERDAAGSVVHSQAVIQDITDRKRIELTLQKSEHMLQTIIDTEPDCIKVIDEESRLILMNRAGLNMIQADSLEQVKGQFVCPLVAPDHRQEFMDLTKEVFQGRSGSLEFQMVGMLGRQLWLETHAVPLRNENDEIIALLGVTRDITARKQTEETLIESEKRFKTLIEQAGDGFELLSDEGRFVDVNSASCRQLGYSREELLGMKIFDIDPKLDSARFTMTLQSMEVGSPISFESAHRRKDGTEFPVEITTSLIVLAGGGKHALALVRDITERKQADVALRASEERFRAITMTASDAIMVMDDLGKIVNWNPAAERIFGYSSEEAVGRDLHAFLAPPRLQQAYRKGFSHFVATGEGPVINRSVEMDAIKKDGTEFPIEVSTSAMNIGGKWHALAIIRDISERKRLEQELIKTQKLESVGTLAGGIAHDFNNLLQGIFGYISLAKMSIEQKDKALAMLEEAEKALHQSVNLTTQLLTFSKGGKPVKKVFNLHPVLENAIRFSLSGSSVDHILLVDDDIRPVDGDEGQISQVIQNIVLNAEQSMALGGRITIAVRNAHRSDIPPLINSEYGDFVAIAVQDPGIGIPPEHIGRIFDPYFTTKKQGSGLGLATSYSIIRNHGGTIQVSSELGKGSTFTIYIPASAAASAEKASQFPVQADIRKGRILVMDDEKMVREVAGALISSLGHEVAFAEHGEAAIRQYREAMAGGRPFDMVILDLTIKGGMGGHETVQKLREIDPEVTAVVSSGYSDDASMSDCQSKGFKAFLKKPYKVESLNRLLRDFIK
ncbi:MAG: PAS domain S-box protein [Nitrospirae bacterium]|nr:PAS domain S-box protein [Nitrospirota bacterium]